MLKMCSSISAPEIARHALLRRPLLGAASNSHAIAPRNGGVTNEAVTSMRMVRRSGMSVRATSQPIGAATAQQTRAELVDTVTVEISGSTNTGLVASSTKVATVKAPVLSVRL